SPPHKAAVLLLDLDRFKAVNDTLGHQAGDELLVEVGRRLHQAVRPTHVVARLGGDEFAVLMPRLTDDAEPVRLAAELQRTLHRATTLDGTPVAISASIGISLAPLHASDPSR